MNGRLLDMKLFLNKTMLHKTKIWTWSYNPNNIDTNSSSGKWLITNSTKYFKDIFPKIDFLVNDGVIFRAKYSHKENLDYDPLPFSEPVMCVYADNSTKDSTLEELVKLGLKVDSWRYDSETRLDWKQGGKLYEESKKQRLVYLLDQYQFNENN